MLPMAQGTVVLKLGATEQAALERSIDAQDYERRRQPHARFWARGDGVVAVLYTSGKLVLQGSGIDLFLLRHLPERAAEVAGSEPPAAPSEGAAGDARGSTAPTSHGEQLEAGPLIGGDESGKGDYFGPLVVAMVRIGEGEAAELRTRGVMDSKKVTDASAHRLGGWIMGRFPHAVRVLDPPEYMARWSERKNVALVLSELYAEAARELLDEGHAEPGDAVLIDRLHDALAHGQVEAEPESLGGRLLEAPKRRDSRVLVGLTAARVQDRERHLGRLYAGLIKRTARRRQLRLGETVTEDARVVATIVVNHGVDAAVVEGQVAQVGAGQPSDRQAVQPSAVVQEFVQHLVIWGLSIAGPGRCLGPRLKHGLARNGVVKVDNTRGGSWVNF